MTDPHLDLLDDAMHSEAVADRARRRLISEAEDQDSTFEGSLGAIAQAGSVVLVDTTVGRTVRGRLDAVGATHLVVVDDQATSYVRVDRITTVRATAGAARLRIAPPDTTSPHATTTDLLADLAHEHTSVDAHLAGGSIVRGQIVRVGHDVLVVRTPATGSDVLLNLALLVVLTVQHRRG